MDLLISIKPNFVEKIILNEKKYEFRKTIFKRSVERIFIYSTFPEKKIVGYFVSGGIIKNSPEKLWENFGDVSGISYESFFNYFKGKDEGFAIKINDLNVFSKPIDTRKLENFKAPQSFYYIDGDVITQ